MQVWWVCDRHVKRVRWEARVHTVVQGTGCPQCREKTRESTLSLLVCQACGVELVCVCLHARGRGQENGEEEV